MIAQAFGRIINISSVVGQSGNFGQANYSSSKAGLIGLTKSVALEVAKRGITVNAIAPGFIDTDMTKKMPAQAIASAIEQTPKRRLGQPDEVAHVVRFLVDEKAGYITGAVYNVNGGWYM
jgi:NAD(P)-dependent dehydrogenase (short-subunit alcohol dehydrogenase family)